MNRPLSFYVIGGQQRAPRALQDVGDDWYDYQKGLILRVTPETGTVETCVEYTTPPSATAEGEAVLFKGGTLVGDTLYVCTQTEILLFELPGFTATGYISLPCFNDLHHVRPTPRGTLLVANSGLEMVLEITRGGKVVRVWNTLGEPPWELYSRDVDYRKGVNLKPHRSHPNFVFFIGDEPWVTRFQQKDAVSLVDMSRRIVIGEERVHDGVWANGELLFTTVNGSIVRVDPRTLAVIESIDLSLLHDHETLLGWCRGLWAEDQVVWVGFSRIRPTRFRELVSWAFKGFRRPMPTHIACYDLKARKLLAQVDLEPHGLNAVFSIIPVPPVAERAQMSDATIQRIPSVAYTGNDS